MVLESLPLSLQFNRPRNDTRPNVDHMLLQQPPGSVRITHANERMVWCPIEKYWLESFCIKYLNKYSLLNNTEVLKY